MKCKVINYLIFLSICISFANNDKVFTAKVEFHVKDLFDSSIDGEYLSIRCFKPVKKQKSDNCIISTFFPGLEYFDTYIKIDAGHCSYKFQEVKFAQVSLCLKEDIERIKKYNKEIESPFIRKPRKRHHEKRVLNRILTIGYTDETINNTISFGGKYTLTLPYLENKQNSEFVSKNWLLKKREKYSFKFPKSLRDFFKTDIVEINNRNVVSGYDFVVDVNDSTLTLNSTNSKIRFSNTLKKWPIIGFAPNAKSRKWKDELLVKYSDRHSDYKSVFIYNSKNDLFGKIAIKDSNHNIELFMSFSTEVHNNYLSQLDLEFGPIWLTKSIDSMINKKSGKDNFATFSPIPEWNYPVKDK